MEILNLCIISIIIILVILFYRNFHNKQVETFIDMNYPDEDNVGELGNIQELNEDLISSSKYKYEMVWNNHFQEKKGLEQPFKLYSIKHDERGGLNDSQILRYVGDNYGVDGVSKPKNNTLLLGPMTGNLAENNDKTTTTSNYETVFEIGEIFVDNDIKDDISPLKKDLSELIEKKEEEIQLKETAISTEEAKPQKNIENINNLKSNLEEERKKKLYLENYQKNFENGDKYTYLKCIRPIPPKKHVVIGDIFTKIKDDTQDNKTLIKTRVEQYYACIPEHCYRKVRDWELSDRVYLSTQGEKVGIFSNPFTNTLTGVSGDGLPAGFVGRIIPCPKKDYNIDILIDRNKKIRKQCMNMKTMIDENPTILTQFEDEKDSYVREKIYNQSKKIETLKQYLKKIKLEDTKGEIVNREYNRNKLQKHLNTQYNTIHDSLKKLQDGGNKLLVNVNYPLKLIDTIQEIIKNSETIPHQNKVETITKLENLKAAGLTDRDSINDALKSCPEFNMDGYVKKPIPCYRCQGVTTE